MRLSACKVALLSTLVAVSPALAATVTPGAGQLYINQGQGFQPVTQPITANPGDMLEVAPGGSASIGYPDGCTTALAPGAVVTVGNVSPCANPYAQQDPSPQQTSPDFNPWVVGVGGAVLAAGLGYGIYYAISP